MEQLLLDMPTWRIRSSDKNYFLFYGDRQIVQIPMTQNDIDRTVDRSNKLKEWSAPYIVHPYVYGINSSKVGYICYPIHPTSEWKQMTTSIPSWITDEHIENILIAFCIMHIVKCGQVGIDSIWLDEEKQQIYIMDYDSLVTPPKFTETFYFKRQPTREFEKIWLDRIKDMWPNVIRKLHKDHFKGSKKPEVEDIRTRMMFR